MTALNASSDSEDTKPAPPKENRAVPTTSRDASGGPRGGDKPPKRARSSPWCCAMLWTVLIVLIAYVALYWTDPEQIAMRQRAWEATMRKLSLEKTVVHASRYSPEFKFRPAASPVVREKLKGGRTRVRGGRPGDDIDPPAPMKRVAPPVTTKRRKKRRAGGTF